MRLDRMTMLEWLQQNDFNSPYLHWYVNYCCRDDFGTEIHELSAWIGIHYFASRKGRSANAGQGDVLTWPEGNGFLVKHLAHPLRGEQLKTGCLVTFVHSDKDGVRIDYYDTGARQHRMIHAGQCILAVPQFVAARLLGDKERLQMVQQHFRYTAWMVANCVVNNLEERAGAPRSWDNVTYDSPSLGYVDATHGLLQQHVSKRNLTYYLPLTKPEYADRTRVAARSYDDWLSVIMTDLQRIHPNIRAATEEVNIMLWGHAMVRPLPGMGAGIARRQLSESSGRSIHFAHTDLAGVSIFDEAFYQGWTAAEKALKG